MLGPVFCELNQDLVQELARRDSRPQAVVVDRENDLTDEGRWVRRPYRNLALAAIGVAIRDAQRPKTAEEAREWLASEGYNWLECSGVVIDYPRWQAWINEGCPSPRLRRFGALGRRKISSFEEDDNGR